MIYENVRLAFGLEFDRKNKAEGLYTLLWNADGSGVVPGAEPGDPRAAIARTREDLAQLAPLGTADGVVSIGIGDVVAWLWEPIGAQITLIHEKAPDYQVAGALQVVLGWIW